ncbi:MAG: O-antigen ligase family protein [Lachnospiraceae bacterium]|nr:O-antigen ligase family protein [Lachnospiraceae bacterium]
MPKRSKYVNPKRFNFALIPIIGVLGIVPIIVRMHQYETHLEDQPYFDRAEYADFFLTWKMYLFIAFTVAMACVTAYKLYQEGKKIRFEKIFIPLGVYAFLALVSSVFSDYQPFPFTGIYEQFENVFTLIGYAMTAYYAYLFVQTEKDLKIVLGALSFSVVIMMLIGLSQAFFTDFYQTDIGKHMILPFSMWDTAQQMTFNFEKGRVYMSLYNPNYVGSFVSFLFPIYLMLALNKWKYRPIMIPACLSVAIGLILVLLGSQSRAGFVGVIMSLVILLVVMNRKIFRHFIPVLFSILLILTVINKMNADADNYYLNRLMSIFDVQESVKPNFSDISAEGDQLHITYCENVLNIEFDYNNETGEYTFHLTDSDGVGINATAEDEQWIIPDDERFSMLKIRAVGLEMYNTAGFGVLIDGKEWYFMNTNDGVKMLSGQLKPATPYKSDTFGPLEGRERFASGRGFIWGKTIPVLLDNLLIGTGPDTFTLAYPNDDLRSSYYGGYENVIITKPHNMYLQIGVQTGIFSLIAILVFYIWYFVLAITTYTRIGKLDMFGLAGVGIFCGSFGYMITQFINDSSITVAPIFWTMIGVGITLLMKTRKDLKEQIATSHAAESTQDDPVEQVAEVVASATEPEPVQAVIVDDSENTSISEVAKNGSSKNKRKGSATRKGRRSR